MALGGTTIPLYDGDVMVSPRDVRILRQLHRFGQLTSAHVRALEFDGLKSKTSADNVLRRLHTAKYIARIERRGVGGWKGGSGQWVYQLGSRGYQYLDIDAANRRRRVVMNEHAIGIADAFVATLEAHRRSEITVHNVRVEHEGRLNIDGVELIPDLYLHMRVAARGRDIRLFVEVDTGWESRDKIEDKLQRYWYFYKHWTEPTFPIVLFLATNPDKLPGLKRKIGVAPEEARKLYHAANLADFPQVLETI